MNVVEEIKKFEEVTKKYKKEMKEKTEEVMIPLAEHVLGDKEGGWFGLIGFTPGFNDGDPCEHTQYPLEETDQAESYFDLEELGFTEENFIDLYSKGEELFRIISDGIHMVYGTDWILLFHRDKDGKVKIEHNEEYDCGY